MILQYFIDNLKRVAGALADFVFRRETENP